VQDVLAALTTTASAIALSKVFLIFIIFCFKII
jgi:hypothetical protein